MVDRWPLCWWTVSQLTLHPSRVSKSVVIRVFTWMMVVENYGCLAAESVCMGLGSSLGWTAAPFHDAQLHWGGICVLWRYTSEACLLPFSLSTEQSQCSCYFFQARQLLHHLSSALGYKDTTLLFEQHTLTMLQSMESTFNTWTQHSTERLVFDSLVIEAGRLLFLNHEVSTAGRHRCTRFAGNFIRFTIDRFRFFFMHENHMWNMSIYLPSVKYSMFLMSDIAVVVRTLFIFNVRHLYEKKFTLPNEPSTSIAK